jgi:sigma-B regulation protein RsbU (phosphoserine phosphatase)
MKDLQFSTRHFYFQKEKYIILIIDDITGRTTTPNFTE